jgi:hypothetical protein
VKRDTSDQEFQECLAKKDFSSVIVNDLDWKRLQEDSVSDIEYATKEKNKIVKRLESIGKSRNKRNRKKLAKKVIKVNAVEHFFVYLPHFTEFVSPYDTKHLPGSIKPHEAGKCINGIICDLVILFHCDEDVARDALIVSTANINTDETTLHTPELNPSLPLIYPASEEKKECVCI